MSDEKQESKTCACGCGQIPIFISTGKPKPPGSYCHGHAFRPGKPIEKKEDE